MIQAKPKWCLAAVTAALLLAMTVAADARADAAAIRGEGWHRVEHEALIDLGRFVDCVTWRYVVRENETLGEIAQRELGSALRHREILALNAGLKPKKLWAGERIVMPPRSTGCQGKGPKWVFFAWSPDASGWAAPRQLVEGATHRVSHGARLYAVPASRLQAVLGQATDSGLDGRVLEREVGVARSGFVTLIDAVPEGDATRRIVTRWRIEDVVDGKIALTRVTEDRFDEAGRLVALPASSSRPGTFLLILSFGLMLAVAGLGVARTQRQRAENDEELAEDVEDDEYVEEDEDEEESVAMDADDEALDEELEDDEPLAEDEDEVDEELDEDLDEDYEDEEERV